MKRFLIVFLFLLGSTVVFAQSIEEEKKVGQNADKYIRSKFKIYNNPSIQDYISKIGHKLLQSIHDPEFKYRFTVIEDPMLNAFALPGGYVYITTGMLVYLDSEAALAGILGHEIGHVIGHHAFKQMEKSMGDTLLIFAGLAGSIAAGQGADTTAAWVIAGSQISVMKQLGYGRELELQGDELGMIYAYEAGYDPREIAKMFQMLQFKERVGGVGYHGFLSTHPDTIERIVKSVEKSQILTNRGKKVETGREKYQKAIRGISWGKSERKRVYKPKYMIEIIKTKKGDTFRSVAREISKDESFAFEIAIMNSMRPDEEFTAGTSLKVPIPRSLFLDKEKAGTKTLGK